MYWVKARTCGRLQLAMFLRFICPPSLIHLCELIYTISFYRYVAFIYPPCDGHFNNSQLIFALVVLQQTFLFMSPRACVSLGFICRSEIVAYRLWPRQLDQIFCRITLLRSWTYLNSHKQLVCFVLIPHPSQHFPIILKLLSEFKKNSKSIF